MQRSNNNIHHHSLLNPTFVGIEGFVQSAKYTGIYTVFAQRLMYINLFLCAILCVTLSCYFSVPKLDTRLEKNTFQTKNQTKYESNFRKN